MMSGLKGLTYDHLYYDPNISSRNHKTCQLLRTISLRVMGLGSLSCLQAFTERVRTHFHVSFSLVMAFQSHY